MSTQIAVRLPDHLVAFLDDLVTSGSARSRAHAVSKALMKYERQLAAERDALIYLETGGYPEFDEWIANKSRDRLDLD